MTTTRCWMLLLLLPIFAGADEPRGGNAPTAKSAPMAVPSDELYWGELIRDQEQALQESAATLRKLHDRQTVKWQDKPLAEAIEELAEITEIPFRLDRQTLRDEGLLEDMRVTMLTSKPQRLVDLLPRLLEPLQLDWRFERREVVISTFTTAQEHLETRGYPVGRLLRLADQRAVVLPSSLGLESSNKSPLELLSASLQSVGGLWFSQHGAGGSVTLARESLRAHQTFRTHREVTALLRTAEAVLSRPAGSPPRLATESEEDETIQTRLQRMLDKEVVVEFNDQPLSDVMVWLADGFDEEFVVDTAALTEEGIALDTPITFQGRLPLRTALRRILEPLSLTYELRLGTVRITTIPNSREHPQTVVYDVADFLKTGHSQQELVLAIEETTSGPWGNVDGEGGTITEFLGGLLVIRQVANVQAEIGVLLHDLRQPPRGNTPTSAKKANDLETRFHRARSKAEAESLESLLMTFVAQATWDVSGGLGVLRTAEDRLIIQQTKAVHDQIDQFLREYQQAKPIGPAANSK